MISLTLSGNEAGIVRLQRVSHIADVAINAELPTLPQPFDLNSFSLKKTASGGDGDDVDQEGNDVSDSEKAKKKKKKKVEKKKEKNVKPSSYVFFYIYVASLLFIL